MQQYDAIIIGAGAAGLMAAITAGRRGLRVLVLDHADKAGAKILISGGGRCNFTNIHTAPDRYLSANPHFAKSALRRYTPADFIALVDGHGIAWHEKTLGQLFCDGSARQIVAMLMAEASDAGVTVKLGHRISRTDRENGSTSGDFIVSSDGGEFSAPRLVLATGGPSIPKMGATGFAYAVAQRFGLKVIPPRPALVPLTLGREDADFMALAGVSFDSVATDPARGKQRFREKSLFTHRGLSGPAILQISSYWQMGDTVTLDMLPDIDAAALLQDGKRNRPKAEAATLLAAHLPGRLAVAVSERLDLKGALGGMSDRRLLAAAQQLKAWPFTPDGHEGYGKAEVTAGGVDTAGLSSQTMEARTVPGLYFIGEAVDVTGWLGGYNFQWAWASGWCAGQAL